MNRRDFIKRLGILAGAAIVAPKAITSDGPTGHKVEGVIYGPPVKFDNKNYGVVEVNVFRGGDTITAKQWAKRCWQAAKTETYFERFI